MTGRLANIYHPGILWESCAHIRVAPTSKELLDMLEPLFDNLQPCSKGRNHTLFVSTQLVCPGGYILRPLHKPWDYVVRLLPRRWEAGGKHSTLGALEGYCTLKAGSLGARKVLKAVY